MKKKNKKLEPKTKITGYKMNIEQPRVTENANK